MKDLRVLVLTPRYPYPPTDGHDLRNYNLFKQFSSGYRFDLLTFGDDHVLKDREDAARRLGPCFEDLIIVPESSLTRVGSSGALKRVTNILYPSRISLGVPFYSEEMSRTTNRLINSGRYDFVIFGGYCMFTYFYQTLCPIPYVVDILDSPALLMGNQMRTQRGIKRKIAGYVEYFWSKRYEQVHFSVAKNLIFISPVDLAVARKHVPGSRLWVVSNGVDTDVFHPDPRVEERPRSLLFTGVMDFEPNKQGAIYFLREIFPLIARREPQVSLTIVGKNPDDEVTVLARQYPNVTVTGFVDDIRKYFDEASVYVCPLLSGAGVKNKILEAWAMAKPIVATSISCNGLDVVNRENAIVANTPGDFAAATLSLLSDHGLRQKLALAGRKCAEERYSWGAQALVLDSIIKEVLTASNGRPQSVHHAG